MFSLSSICRYTLVINISWLAIVQAEDSQLHPQSDTEIRSHVDRLVEKLGDPSYAARTRALRELEGLGLVAFDALLEASKPGDDVETAMAARYLVESLQVQWSTPDDPEKVKQILSDYGKELSEVARESRMDRLAALPDRQGLAALCRLVRFETTVWLSRKAALLIMGQELADSSAERRRNGSIVRESLGSNTRVASRWLSAYAKDLISDSYGVPKWRELIQEEVDRVAGHTTKQTDDMVVLDLYRLCAVRAQRYGLESETLRLAFESLSLVDSRVEPLRSATTWAIDHRLWPVVLHLYERDRDDFERSEWLLYAVAEAMAETGRPDESEGFVNTALAINSIEALNEDGTSPMSDDELEQAVQKHNQVAAELVERGRFVWAEREYRYVIDRSPVNHVLTTFSRLWLAQMLDELLRPQEAADALDPVVERMAKDRDFRRQVEAWGFITLDDYESSLRLYQARAYKKVGEIEAARKSLRKALSAEPFNADVLIEMFRLPGDEQWKNTVNGSINKAAAQYEQIIESFERILRNEGQRKLGEMPKRVSTYCNDYAWLVANTKGDFKRALNYSLRSIELRPDDAALTDTLAHCYYALKDFDSAVQTQQIAYGISPHSPAIKRQLDFFTAERDKAFKADSKAKAADK